MTQTVLALVYGALVLAPVAMHLGLAAGAPWGAYTLGGRHPGRLPPRLRAFAPVQAALLLAMAASVLDRAGVLALGLPGVAFWGALALTLLTFVANTITSSKRERRLWSPITGAMSLAALGVALT